MEKNRVEHWNKGHKEEFQGMSYTHPMNQVPKHLNYIRGKKILEIGPGDGRQLHLLKPYSNEYAIADISPVCLFQYEKSINKRYLINSFDDNFEDKFDVICLFYVWHYVISSETEAYMDFLERHLNDEGHMCFNISKVGHQGGHLDGTKTTARNPDEFKKFLIDRGYEIVFEKDGEPNNYLYLIKK
jgi:SAM-dependent methyltransferase